MKLFLISDNKDTWMGMRLAGIEGVVVHEREEVQQAVRSAFEDPQVSILLITEKLASLCPELIEELKSSNRRKLVTEIPDRHGGNRAARAMEQYVNEALGVRM